MEIRLTSHGAHFTLSVERDGEVYRIRIGERSYEVTLVRLSPDEIVFRLPEQTIAAQVAYESDHCYVAIGASVYPFSVVAPQTKRNTRVSSAINQIRAPMHGQVVKVLVAEGDLVRKGQPLIILEAMKMEIRAAAPQDGQVAQVLCAEGHVVERGQALLVLK